MPPSSALAPMARPSSRSSSVSTRRSRPGWVSWRAWRWRGFCRDHELRPCHLLRPWRLWHGHRHDQARSRPGDLALAGYPGGRGAGGGSVGIMSFGHATFFGLGAYGTAIVTIKLGLDPAISPWLGILAGVALAGVVSGS